MEEILKVPDLELKILQILWKNNKRASVQKIIELWVDKPAPGYTTVLKKLQVMEEKGLVVHEKAGRAFDYIPVISKEEVSRSKINNMLSTLFQGNRLDMVGAFFSETELTNEELAEIKRMIDEQGAKND